MKKKQVRTRVGAVQCLKCKSIIYSRARHDFKWCKCHSVFVDGGFDYLKIGGYASDIKTMIKYVPYTKKELYDDWNLAIDKLGTIDENKKLFSK